MADAYERVGESCVRVRMSSCKRAMQKEHAHMFLADASTVLRLAVDRDVREAVLAGACMTVMPISILI